MIEVYELRPLKLAWDLITVVLTVDQKLFERYTEKLLQFWSYQSSWWKKRWQDASFGGVFAWCYQWTNWMVKKIWWHSIFAWDFQRRIRCCKTVPSCEIRWPGCWDSRRWSCRICNHFHSWILPTCIQGVVTLSLLRGFDRIHQQMPSRYALW